MKTYRHSREGENPAFFTFIKQLIAVILVVMTLSGISFLNAAYYYLGDSDDDAEERISDGDMSLGSNDLEMAYDDSGSDPDRGLQIIGLRFNAVNIPVGATITSAKIRFSADNTNSGTTSLIINGQLANDASGFSDTNYNLSSRTQTAASVTWNVSSWTNDNYYETGDITSVVQEIVNQSGYAGDDLVLFIRPGSGCSTSACVRRADSRDESTTNAPRLEITYSVPEVSPVMGDIPNQTATVGTPFTLNIANYVTLTNGDPLIAPYYTLTGTPPAGLNFNSTTGVISGTPTTVTASTNFTVTATDNDGVSNADSFTISVIAAPVATSGYRDFTLRKQLYVKGDMKTIGNTVLVPPTGSDTTNNCSTYVNGPFISNAGSANNSYFLCGYHVDTANADANGGTFTNSTSSELIIPNTAKVVWAGLYWQGIVQGNVNTNMSIKLRKDGSSYVDIIPDTLNYNNSTGYSTDPGGNATGNYAAFADVSDYFGDGKWNEGNYTVANVPVYEGKIGSLGTYGAWTLVVVYEDSDENEKYRSYSIFDGWKAVNQTASAVPVDITGFYTPNRTNITAKVSVFAAEGDKYIENDHFNTKNYNTNAAVTLEPVNNNSFNSSISGGDGRTPLLTNNNGIDIQTYNIGDYLKPKQTDMQFTFTSDQDAYWPSMLAFSTEIYAPQLCYDYSIKQDGRYLSLDRNTYPMAHINGQISSSDMDVMIYLRNKEADFSASGISIYNGPDLNTSRFNYAGGEITVSNINGSALIGRGTPNSSNPLCAYDEASGNGINDIGCTDGHRIRKGNGSLGSEEYVYTKFSLSPQQISGIFDTVDETLDMKIDYYITVNGHNIPYHGYTLGGGNVPICPPSNIYQPAWGAFNIVQSGQANNNIKNNINTQISRKPFKTNVVFDSTPTTGDNAAPASDVNTTVLVEMIDIDSFGDVNASCANPDANVSAPIFVPLTFTSSNWQTLVTPQNSDYHNFALKNGAFRVWYFTDQNKILRNWSPTGLADSNRTISGIATSGTGLFEKASHPICAVAWPNGCGTNGESNTTKECFVCMKNNYAKPLCSRDNFSVRPEAIDIRISDINQTTLATSRALSDSTQYGYSPNRTPSGKMNLASGYLYQYDINATGHDANASGFAGVPRYTRYFNGARDDYNATLIWDPSTPKTGCNDTANRSLSFFVQNGSKANQHEKQSQVGEYRLNMIDTTWTAVDQVVTGSNVYRTTGNGFAVGQDCLAGQNTTSYNTEQAGCHINSDHTVANLQYKDQNLTFRPYQFAMNGGFRLGVGSAVSVPPSIALNPGDSKFLYMNDLGVLADRDMALRGDYQIIAQGADNVQLSNFVNNCYANDINLTLFYTPAINPTPVVYQASFSDKDTATAAVLQNTPVNVVPTPPLIPPAVPSPELLRTVDDSNFTKAGMGAIATEVFLNYNRSSTVLVNPITVTFGDYGTRCANLTECEHSANGLMDNNATGVSTTGFNVTHYYGRAQGQYTRIRSPQGQANAIGNTRIGFEVFCGNDGTTNCNPANVATPLVLPSGVIAPRGEDIGWYLNLDHSDTDPTNGANHSDQFFTPYGRADLDMIAAGSTETTANVTLSEGEINGVNGINVTATQTGFERFGVNYGGANGYPYSIRIQNNPSPWLIYNPPGDTNLLSNEFMIEFNKQSGWVGESTSGGATDNNAAINTSRRIMW